MIIIKFGGSVITTEKRADGFDSETAHRLATELKQGGRAPCIIVHGTGVVGKPPAERHGFAGDGVLPRERRHIALGIRQRLRGLNLQLVNVLHDAGLDAIPIDGLLGFDMESSPRINASLRNRLDHLLQEEVMPVCYGDMLPLKDGGYRVLSSDEIMVELARLYNPEQALFLTDVDGVYGKGIQSDGAREILPEVTPATLANVYRSDRDQTDVSGGMQAKLASAFDCARHAGRCVIAGGRRDGALRSLLRGESPSVCTRIIA